MPRTSAFPGLGSQRRAGTVGLALVWTTRSTVAPAGAQGAAPAASTRLSRNTPGTQGNVIWKDVASANGERLADLRARFPHYVYSDMVTASCRRPVCPRKSPAAVA